MPFLSLREVLFIIIEAINRSYVMILTSYVFFYINAFAGIQESPLV